MFLFTSVPCDDHCTNIPLLPALFYGLASMAMAFLAKNMGGVLQIAIAVYGGCTGPVLAIFVLGLFIPFSNPKVSVVAS